MVFAMCTSIQTPMKSRKYLSGALQCNETWKSYKYMQPHNYHRHRRSSALLSPLPSSSILWLSTMHVSNWYQIKSLDRNKRAREQVTVQSYDGWFCVHSRRCFCFRCTLFTSLKNGFIIEFWRKKHKLVHCHWPQPQPWINRWVIMHRKILEIIFNCTQKASCIP